MGTPWCPNVQATETDQAQVKDMDLLSVAWVCTCISGIIYSISQACSVASRRIVEGHVVLYSLQKGFSPQTNAQCQMERGTYLNEASLSSMLFLHLVDLYIGVTNKEVSMEKKRL